MAAADGLDATGIDIAPTAIRLAEAKAAERGLQATFVVGDACRVTFAEPFETVLDCGLFHTFDDEDRGGLRRSISPPHCVPAVATSCSASAIPSPATGGRAGSRPTRSVPRSTSAGPSRRSGPPSSRSRSATSPSAPGSRRSSGRVTAARSFDALIEEAEHAPIDGWDFTWLDGRATEERPTWRYSERVADASRPRRPGCWTCSPAGARCWRGSRTLPPLLVASEGYAPNVAVAAAQARARAAPTSSRRQDDRAALPFAGETFDLVTSRHPVQTWWSEIARVLRPGGTYFSQQVGPDSVREPGDHADRLRRRRAQSSTSCAW